MSASVTFTDLITLLKLVSYLSFHGRLQTFFVMTSFRSRLSGNYTVDESTTATADIKVKVLTPSAVADDKVYDGTAAATGTIILPEVIGSDVVTATGIFTFSDALVETNKTVTVTGITLEGNQAGTECAAGETSIDLALTPGAKDIYIKVKDGAGNKSDALMMNIPEYVMTDSVNGNPLAGGSAAVSLSTGDNTIIIEVTAQDGTTQKTYTLNIDRARGSSSGTPPVSAETPETTTSWS